MYIRVRCSNLFPYKYNTYILVRIIFTKSRHFYLWRSASAGAARWKGQSGCHEQQEFFAWRWNSAGALSSKRCGLVAKDRPRHANVKIYGEMVRGVLWTDSWNDGHGHAETSATVKKLWETKLHEWLQHSIEIHLLKDGYKVMYNTHHMVYIEFRRLTRFQNFMPSFTILFAKTRIWGIFAIRIP